MKLLTLNKITILTSILVTLLIFVFVYLNLSSKPTISTIQFTSKNKDESYSSTKSVSDAQIRIYYNRPMSKTALEDKVSIFPNDTDFSATWFGNGFVINFKEALSYSTEYTLTIGEGLDDLYNDKPTDEYNFKFKTKSAQIAYIERSPDSDVESVVTYDIETQEKKVIYSNTEIKLFQNVGDVFAIVTADGNKDNLILFDSNSLRVIKDFNFQSINITDLEADKYNSKFAIISQEIEDKDQYFVPVTNSKISIINIESHDIEDFIPLENAQGILDIEFNKDYSGLIFKLPDSLYYVSEFENPQNTSTIGRYLYFGNFSRDGSNAVLLEYDPLASTNLYQYIIKLNSEREKTNLTSGEHGVIDPQFFNKNDDVYFSNFYSELTGTKGLYKISKISEGNLTDVFFKEHFSLEHPLSSADDSYLVMESFNELQLLDYRNLRNFGFQTKPYYGEILIYDLVNSVLINSSLKGVNPTFLE